MEGSLNIKNILSQVEKLDKNEQKTLLQQLSFLLKKSDFKSDVSTKLTLISGLGKEIWGGTNIENYIHEERKW